MYSVDFTDIELQTLLEVMVDYGKYLDSLDDEDKDYLEVFDDIFKKLVSVNEINDVLF
jgi:hypothetical protein